MSTSATSGQGAADGGVEATALAQLAGFALEMLFLAPLAAVFLGLGTVLWYAAAIGTTWYLAHVVALIPALLAVETALGGEGDADDRSEGPRLQGRALRAGLLLGLAATARLPVALGLPFLLLAGGRAGLRERLLPTILGLAIPLAALGLPAA